MKIIKAQPIHANFIIDSQIKMALETEKLNLNQSVVEMGVNAVFSNSQLGQYYIVENHEPIACCLITYEWSDWRNSLVWWLQSVYVIKEMRGKGVFKFMHQFLKDEILKSTNVSGLRLYVDKSNHDAIKVYQKLSMTNQHYELFEWLK